MNLKLVVIRGKSTGLERLLEGDVFVLGSTLGAHLRLDDEGVRDNHARIFRDEGRYILMDTTGAGVSINGKATVQAELRAGDELAVGSARLRVSDAAAPVPADPPGASGGSNATQGPAAELRILKGPDEGKQVPVAERVTLGRGVTADFPLLDMKCSREHCRVERRDDGWVLVDLGSTNGTKLNEVRLESKSSHRLRAGDKIKLGATVVEFAVGAGAAKAPAATRDPARPPTRATPLVPPGKAAVPTPLQGMATKTFEIDLDDAMDATPPSVPLPRAEDSRRGAVTQRVERPSGFIRKMADAGGSGASAAALSGDLEKMGFAEVVQFLNISHKSGDLIVHSSNGECGMSFDQGNVRDAWAFDPGRTAEQSFYAIARLRTGRFEFHENAPKRTARITQGTLALLMEAMRLVDEATDPGD